VGCNCGKKANQPYDTSAARNRSKETTSDDDCPQCDFKLKKAVGYMRCYSCGYNRRIRR